MQPGNRSLTTAEDLVRAGLIEARDVDIARHVIERYAVSITPAVLGTIDRSDPMHDPVALQYVPSAAELSVAAGESADPIGDARHSPLRGLVHRYPDRVLVQATLVCPVYCRFCFRRETVGGNAAPPLSEDELDAIAAYVRARPEIWEVILSGGDPLVLSTRRLGEILAKLAGIDHVRVVRIHTRVPVVAPERADDALLDLLSEQPKTVYVALHANHKNEFSPAARDACRRIVRRGIPMISQTVLLRGINDSETALADLMRTFVENGITPYYLHQLDAAPGTAHFRVPVARGQALMRRLRGRYSGLCQPTYVMDIPGGHGKSPIGPVYVHASSTDAERLEVEAYTGDRHPYPTERG